MNVVIVFAMLCGEPFATFNCTASPKGGRRHLPRRTGRNRRAVRSIRRRNAPPRMDGYKGGGIRRRGYHGRREFVGVAASLPATLHRSAPADPHSNSPGSVARSARPAADFRALRVNRDRQKRRAVARRLITGDRTRYLRGSTLRNIQRQTDIALRAMNRQAAHQAVWVGQRLFVFETEAENRTEKDNPVVAAIGLHA